MSYHIETGSEGLVSMCVASQGYDEFWYLLQHFETISVYSCSDVCFCLQIFRLYQSLLNIRLSFQSGTMMDQVPDKHPVMTVKWSYSKILIKNVHSWLYLPIVSWTWFLNSISSPQAIFKDPFRGGNNILVRIIFINILEYYFISRKLKICRSTIIAHRPKLI